MSLPRRHSGGRQGHADEIRPAPRSCIRWPAGRSIDHVLRTSAQLSRRNDRARRRPWRRRSARVRWRAFARLEFVVQSPQLGTGHALLQTEPVLARPDGHGAAALCRRSAARGRHAAAAARDASRSARRGDRPDRRARRSLRLRPHRARRAPAGSRGSSKSATRRVPSGRSAKSTAASTPSIWRRCSPSLHGLATDNAQGEYYLTDLVAHVPAAGTDASRRSVSRSSDELRGVNSRVDLAELTAVVRARKNREADARRASRSKIRRPRTSTPTSRIGADTVIGPGVMLAGRTTVGARCRIHAGVAPHERDRWRRRDDPRSLRHRRIDARRPARPIGPFAHLRPGIGRSAKTRAIGNFVELKKTTLGARSKANHLAYLGDATIGERRQHRRRHDHLQLRRREETPDGHRRRRVHRQRLAARRAGHGSAAARTSRPARRSPRTCPPTRWRSRGRGRRTSRTGRRSAAPPRHDRRSPESCAASSGTSAPSRWCRS